MRWRRPQRGTRPSVDDLLEREFFLQDEVLTVVDDAGDPFLVAFTSEGLPHQRLSDAPEPTPLRGSNVLALLLEIDCAGVVIDPGASDSFTISRSEAEELVPASHDVLWAGPRVLVARPDEPPPPALVDALRRACEHDPNVHAAHVFLAALPGQEEHVQPVLGVEQTSGDELSAELIASLQEATVPPADAAAGLGGYLSMDIRALDNSLLAVVREAGITVYERRDPQI